jgi:hypothetical protein
MKLTKRQIDNLYFDKLINSLEKDYKNWKHTRHGGAGWSWSEWFSPIYENENGQTITFGFTLNYNGAYINGRLGWVVSFLQAYNIFSPTTYKFWWLIRRMKKHLLQIERENHLEKLKNSL